MSLNLKQIFLHNDNTDNTYVTYENKLQPQMIFKDLSYKTLFEKHYEEIFRIIVCEINNYLNDEKLCNDELDMFPRKCEMTGEWYIGYIRFKDINYISVEVRFLGFHPDSKRMHIDDYLCLDVHFYYNKFKDQFIFDGVDSSCI